MVCHDGANSHGMFVFAGCRHRWRGRYAAAAGVFVSCAFAMPSAYGGKVQWCQVRVSSGCFYSAAHAAKASGYALLTNDMASFIFTFALLALLQLWAVRVQLIWLVPHRHVLQPWLSSPRVPLLASGMRMFADVGPVSVWFLLIP